MKYKTKKSAVQIRGLFGSVIQHKVKRKPPGQPPGTVLHTGIKKIEELKMTLHDFDENHYENISIEKITDAERYIKSASKTWIQIHGLHDIEKLMEIWNFFDIHPLVQEDIVSVNQRPKVEPYDDIIFIVLRMIKGVNNTNEELQTEQLSIVLGKNYVLSFQESDDSLFDPIIRRLTLSNTRLRRLSCDYLAYALLDNVVDHYFSALDMTGELLESIEEQVISNPKPINLRHIHALRRDLIFLRKSVWSLRDGLNSLIRDESPLISTDVKVFLRDVYDHIVQVIDSIENHREMVFSLYDMYMSGLSNRMNEIMKVLTIIATIFIPLTFIAGIYGMNFNPETSPLNMPELNWEWGYPASLLIMATVAAIMMFYFKRKGWL
ncbi:magnesium/cobalt transporter CorA [Natronoflexus pectinivorans]|uniref:Magnesium transport protein CorA n=1 Tax=Natronoflexus pectinivorans TaxID=682526 RepID=A0A4R2GKW4_9BACT|nr:magnesium/cobalt transporter CorA [Natronoflexus pectinivorans]TCO08876.1 magnesium transporter [Natronoflexus pectinivorans]